MKKKTSQEVPLFSDKDKEKKVPIFDDALSHTFGSKGPLVYIVRENAEVPDVGYDDLTENSHYGASGSMLEELINNLPHAGPIFCDDNKTVFMMIPKAVAGTSMDSTIKFYSRRIYGWAEFLALISNHAGDTKY